MDTLNQKRVWSGLGSVLFRKPAGLSVHCLQR